MTTPEINEMTPSHTAELRVHWLYRICLSLWKSCSDSLGNKTFCLNSQGAVSISQVCRLSFPH